MKLPLIRSGRARMGTSGFSLITSGKSLARIGRHATLLALVSLASFVSAADYYVDPATGSMSNPGTQASPWSTLQAVFAANKTFQPGDVIYLRSGFHGYPIVKGRPSGVVTIRPDGNAVPLVQRLRVDNAENWVITGLDVCHEHLSPGSYQTASPLVDITANNRNIQFIGNRVRAALSIAGWTQSDWETRLGYLSAIASSAPNTTISGNTMENVSFGVTLQQTAENSVVAGNEIINFMCDAYRGLASNCLFEGNLARNNYVDNAVFNHDDFFQSWSRGPNGVGTSTVFNLTVRGNVFISQTDPNQPLPGRPQGIGCFDGMYENMVVENNLVVLAGTTHGISLYGAINCRIVNNTVLANPVAAVFTATGEPSVRIFQHKKYGAVGWEFIAPASGNVIRNNLVTQVVAIPSGGGVADSNLTQLARSLYANYFTNANALDFSLLPTAPAVDAGSQISAPATDIIGAIRSLPYDIGAFEFIPDTLAYEGFNYAPTLSVGTSPDSPDDFGFTGITWSGASDIVSGSLTYPGVNPIGNMLVFGSNVSAVRSIDMAAFPAAFKVVGTDGVTRLGAPGTTLWIRFLLRVDGADAVGTLESGLGLLGATSGGILKLRFGDVGPGQNFGIRRGSDTPVLSTTPVVTGQTVLLVARITYVAGAANDEVDLFINPPLTTTAPTTPSASIRNLDLGLFDRLEAKGNRASAMDEIAVAADWNNL